MELIWLFVILEFCELSLVKWQNLELNMLAAKSMRKLQGGGGARAPRAGDANGQNKVKCTACIQ